MSQSLRECLLLIPCSGLDDFPETLPSAHSQQLLNGWLSLWHPALLAQTHAAPRWQAADQPPHDLDGLLVVTSDSCRTHLPSDLAGTAERGGGWLVDSDRDWRTLQLEWLQRTGTENRLPAATAEYWQGEFAALGYAYLQIQLLTRQLRYTSNLDQSLFDGQLNLAAIAALAGDAGEAEKMLQSCFDQLGQERDHYYSLDVSLLDVTLLASTTLGSSVTDQLGREHPTTFVASASLLRQMKASQPAVADALQRALADRRASLAGGLDIERPHPLMSFDSLKRDLDRGREAYRQLGFQPPTVFTRFSYGQLSDMPLHLRRSGFVASMLIAWQQGTYPNGSHAKFSWEAAEGTFLNAIAPPLVNAQDATTYLTLGRRIAEALDHQHVPVFMLAHWPDSYSPFFQLLQRVIARTPALGRWHSVDDFFEKTDQPYHQEHLPPRKFAFDWLAWQPAGAGQAIPPDQLLKASRRYQSLAAETRALQNLLNLCYQLENFRATPLSASSTSVSSHGDVTSDNASTTNGQELPAPRALTLKELNASFAQLVDQLDSIFDQPGNGDSSAVQLQAALSQVKQSIAMRFAKAAGHTPLALTENSDSSPASAEQLIVSTSSTPQRFTLTGPVDMAPASAGSWLYATGRSGEQRLSMVDVPGYGMLRVASQRSSAAPKRREPTLVQGDGLLINDFLEAQLDPRTGSLRGLHIPGKRGNRLSVQLARRTKVGTAAAEYSQLQATELRTLENSTVRGVVRASGHLLQEGQRIGAFEIDYSLTRGHRALEMTIRLSDLASSADSPWKSAYVLRTAWPNESSIITCRTCGSRQVWASGKAVAPTIIEIDDVDHRTYLLTNGLAYHQRVDERFLETILATGNSVSAVDLAEIHFAVAVDLPNPVIAANSYGLEPIAVPVLPSASSPASSSATTAAWLMHIDAKHVVMDLEAPLVDEAGNCIGMRLHLSELANKSVTAKIRALREVVEAHRVDYLGGRIAKLTVEGDTTSIALRPSEMTFVDLLWK